MAPVSISRFAAVNYRRKQNRTCIPKSTKEYRRRHHHRSVLSIFTFAPHVLYSAFSMIAEYENRQIQQPLLRLRTLITRTVQDGILTALFHLLTRKTTSRVRTGVVRDTVRRPRRCRVEARKSCETALRLERELDLDGAIEQLEHAVELQPDNLKYLAMLSKQYTDMSFAPNITPEKARDLNCKALELAERIVELKPMDPVGHIARGVSKGRLAYYSSNQRKIELAREAEDSVKDALVLDQSCDLGHHLLGRFHYEMAGLNVFCRTFVRVVYGQTMSPGSYEEALKEFKIATSLQPSRLIHKIQLGKTHVKLGNRQEAIESLQEAMDMEVTDINDHLELQDGIELLKKLQKKH
eukprot:g2454.t1